MIKYFNGWCFNLCGHKGQAPEIHICININKYIKVATPSSATHRPTMRPPLYHLFSPICCYVRGLTPRSLSTPQFSVFFPCAPFCQSINYNFRCSFAGGERWKHYRLLLSPVVAVVVAYIMLMMPPQPAKRKMGKTQEGGWMGGLQKGETRFKLATKNKSQ